MRTLLVMLAMFFGTAAASENVRIGVPADLSSIDPHFQVLGPNANIARHVFEALIRTGDHS